MEKRYGLPTAICMVVGIVIGSGVFFKAEKVLQATKGNMPLGILAWGIVGAIMIICSYVFATMATRYEKVSGLVDYAEATVGRRYAYYVGWFMAVLYTPCLVSALAWISARYFCVLLGWDITGGACMTIAGAMLCLDHVLNALAPRLAGRFQVSTTVIKMIPLALMAACGAVLREVGSTNKTHLSDYANAISEQTRALLKVHTSNYRIVGFTESVSPAALAELGRSRSIPVIEDLGSGCLVDLAPLGLRDEPTVQASVKAGVDVLSFSGDKLLGGPQAGIIVGKRRCIDLLKRHPLARALRVDKLTLAALEATLQAYVDGTALQEIPVLSMLAQTPEELRQRAESLCRRMGESGVTAEVVSTENPVGGGAVPTQTLHSFAVAVVPRDSAAALEAQLRQRPVPIIVRIAHDRCLLDMRTLFPADLDEILQAFRETAS